MKREWWGCNGVIPITNSIVHSVEGNDINLSLSLKLMSKETNASTDNGGIVDYDFIFVRVWNGLGLVLYLFVELNSGWSPSLFINWISELWRVQSISLLSLVQIDSCFGCITFFDVYHGMQCSNMDFQDYCSEWLFGLHFLEEYYVSYENAQQLHGSLKSRNIETLHITTSCFTEYKGLLL